MANIVAILAHVVNASLPPRKDEKMNAHYDYDLDFVRRHAPAEDPSSLLGWLARQPVAVACEAVKLQTDLLRQRRTEAPRERQVEFRFAMLLTAIDKMLKAERGYHRKEIPDHRMMAKLENLRVGRINVQKAAKPAEKARILKLRYSELIKKLRGEGLSWRKVATYLRKYHRFKVARSYLEKVFKEEVYSK